MSAYTKAPCILGWVLTSLAGCAPAAPPQATPKEDSTILRRPESLTPDFSVRQHVEAVAGDKKGAFDAVLQKRAAELVIVGLGPMGVRAFVLRQDGGRISFEQSMGPTLPFPPRYVVVDVHRAFFKSLPPEVSKGEVDGEDVEEDWAAGNLVERRFRKPGGEPKGMVRITYEPGCTRARCAPPKLRIVNEWHGYTLTITNTDYAFF